MRRILFIILFLAISCQLSAVSNYVNRQQISSNSISSTLNFQFSPFNFQHLYINKLFRYNQWAFYEHEGKVKEMMITGYDRFGRLILKEKNDREVVCDLKEILFKI